MKWTKPKISRIADEKVRKRLERELSRDRGSPLTGSLAYWTRLVHGKNVCYRENPELYHIGKGQQGVLSVEPYKSEILPYWKFRDEDSAFLSADAIYCLFELYLAAKDFVGADMSKKFLHMGFTRARRYANHRSGRKYDDNGKIREPSPQALTGEKAWAAQVFKLYWDQARTHPVYLKLKDEHRQLQD